MHLLAKLGRYSRAGIGDPDLGAAGSTLGGQRDAAAGRRVLHRVIDKVCQRLEKEIGKLDSNLEKGQAKLQNANFVDKAPAAVVEKERQRVAEMEKARQQLQQQAEKIRAL